MNDYFLTTKMSEATSFDDYEEAKEFLYKYNDYDILNKYVLYCNKVFRLQRR